MFKHDKMDNKLEDKKPKTKKASKSYSGIVLKPIVIGSKYDWRKKRGEKVSGLSKKEYDNYKLNKIIE